MESVARQFATNQHVMVVRNGWFSYRWTEILEMGNIAASHTVCKAQPIDKAEVNAADPDSINYSYQPYPIADLVAKIHEERPAVLFAPHVETSVGMILPDDYIRAAAAAVHEVGGIMVLDCIASGTIWCDMKALGIDVLISAPQKGWTGPPCAALVQLSQRAVDTMYNTQETSFSMSLKRWCALMDTYEKGGFAYHTTMPTDALRLFHEISVETLGIGLPALKQAQYDLGATARSILDSKGLKSVSAPGCQAPGILVYYSPENTDNPVMMGKFKEVGLQIALGVPWKIDEPDGLKTFRIGLFGLDKLTNIGKTTQKMEEALDKVLAATGYTVPSDVKKAA
jgi:alanine-glyoxylate transaminase / serine-glyoxylate transaminase / serine-pyruvate transaminase